MPQPQLDSSRKKIKDYFAKQNFVPPVIVFVIGILFLIGSKGIGAVLCIVGLAWAAYLFKIKNSATDEDIDRCFKVDMEDLKERSMQRLNLEVSDLAYESLIITGPILWTVNGIPSSEVSWKKGKDGRVRFSVHGVTIIHLTSRKLSAYQCSYNSIRGVAIGEHDDEYFYRDVVAVSTKEESTNYTLPNMQIMKLAQSFSLSVASGERISVIVSSGELEKYVKGQVSETGADRAVKALRKVLSETKQ